MKCPLVLATKSENSITYKFGLEGKVCYLVYHKDQEYVTLRARKDKWALGFFMPKLALKAIETHVDRINQAVEEWGAVSDNDEELLFQHLSAKFHVYIDKSIRL